jgi:Protein of unknown function (DUF3035)
MRHNHLTGLAFLAVALALSGCGNSFRESLGLNRNAPDEFQVVAHAPLSMPPDIALQPPLPGAARPQEASTRTAAQSIVINSGSGQAEASTLDLADRSPGEAVLLQSVGAVDIDPNIRQVVEDETAAQVERDRSVISRLNFWRTQEPYGVVVDPVAESQRIQRNLEEGKPITEGDTPFIKKKKKGLLEGIF